MGNYFLDRRYLAQVQPLRIYFLYGSHIGALTELILQNIEDYSNQKTIHSQPGMLRNLLNKHSVAATKSFNTFRIFLLTLFIDVTFF